MKTLRNILFTSLVLLVASTVYAEQKLGHINSQELFSIMPETDSAQKKLEKIAQDHEMTLEELTVEFNKKFEDYQQNVSTYSDLKRATVEGQLQEAQNRIQTFQQTAEQDIKRKQAELFQPIQQKALNAVNEVAEENGFTYIFDQGMGAIVFTGETAIDIMPLVKKKLGLE